MSKRTTDMIMKKNAEEDKKFKFYGGMQDTYIDLNKIANFNDRQLKKNILIDDIREEEYVRRGNDNPTTSV